MEPNPFIVISGKMFSGKDTLADDLARRLRAGGRTAHRLTFSDVLCTEADPGIDAMRTAPAGDVVAAVADAAALTQEHAAEFVEAILPDLRDDPELIARKRTPGTRFVLQHLGREWRPEGYWAKKVIETCIQLRDHGDAGVLSGPVIMVGARFPEEYELAQAAGAFTVRLDISAAEQDARSMARDGHLPDEAARNHLGETILDDRDDFDLRLTTDGMSPEEVADKVWAEMPR